MTREEILKRDFETLKKKHQEFEIKKKVLEENLSKFDISDFSEQFLREKEDSLKQEITQIKAEYDSELLKTEKDLENAKQAVERSS